MWGTPSKPDSAPPINNINNNNSQTVKSDDRGGKLIANLILLNAREQFIPGFSTYKHSVV